MSGGKAPNNQLICKSILEPVYFSNFNTFVFFIEKIAWPVSPGPAEAPQTLASRCCKANALLSGWEEGARVMSCRRANRLDLEALRVATLIFRDVAARRAAKCTSAAAAAHLQLSLLAGGLSPRARTEHPAAPSPLPYVASRATGRPQLCARGVWQRALPRPAGVALPPLTSHRLSRAAAALEAC